MYLLLAQNHQITMPLLACMPDNPFHIQLSIVIMVLTIINNPNVQNDWS